MTTGTIMTLHASQPRRVLACAILVGLGGVFLWVAMTRGDTSGASRLIIVAFGAFWLWAGVKVWRVTSVGLELTDTLVRETSGTVIVRLEEISGMDRGVFAMKPSNGVLLKLSESGAPRWVPGLWWRLGRRVGIGGLTPKNGTKALAETLEALVRQE